MSIYPNGTQQELINLIKLAEQRKNQRVLKIKIRFSKQTHDINSAENLSPINKKITEVKESTQKLGEIIKEKNTLQLAIENTEYELPIQNEPIHPGVKYDTLENTLSNMQNQNGFFRIEEKTNSDIISNGYPLDTLGVNKLKIDEDI